MQTYSVLEQPQVVIRGNAAVLHWLYYQVLEVDACLRHTDGITDGIVVVVLFS